MTQSNEGDSHLPKQEPKQRCESLKELPRGEGEKLMHHRVRMRRSCRQEAGNTEKGEKQIWDDEEGAEIREKVINIKDRPSGREGNK